MFNYINSLVYFLFLRRTISIIYYNLNFVKDIIKKIGEIMKKTKKITLYELCKVSKKGTFIDTIALYYLKKNKPCILYWNLECFKEKDKIK